MPDVLYLAVTVAFFVAAAGFVTLCDRIIGPDPAHGDPRGIGEAVLTAGDGAGATDSVDQPEAVATGRR